MLYFLEKKNQNISDLINRYLYSKYRFMSLYGEENFIEFGCMLARKLSISLAARVKISRKGWRTEETSHSFSVCREERKEKDLFVVEFIPLVSSFLSEVANLWRWVQKEFFFLPFPCYREVRLVSELWSLKESALNLTFTRKRR